MKTINKIKEAEFYLDNVFSRYLESLVNEITKLLEIRRILLEIKENDIKVELDISKTESNSRIQIYPYDGYIKIVANLKENLPMDNIDELSKFINSRILEFKNSCNYDNYKNIKEIKIKRNEYSTEITNLLVKNFEVEFYE